MRHHGTEQLVGAPEDGCRLAAATAMVAATLVGLPLGPGGGLG